MEKKKDLKTLGIILTIFIISLLYYFNKVNNENKDQNDIKVTQNTILSKERKINHSEFGNKPDGFITIKKLSDIDGIWTNKFDKLRISSSKKYAEWNSSGAKMKLDYIDSKKMYPNDKNLPHQTYIFGSIGNSKVLRTRVYINLKGDEIYLDRIDGGISNFYKKAN